LPRRAGFAYAAFLINVYALYINRLTGEPSHPHELRAGALEQILHERRPAYRGGLIHHSNGGSQ